ncbi:four helix bundle protein [Flavobacterium caeni]|uniref:Four helix bundle protein n=1 Tax=Flavobacterium caeni TaxID=490189 RepID=A0A1G5CFI0_9FLAO|nr:four helix bundle protein [Flavobacterium caeni]SCY01071.1 four helix bundle protein [Flavobacterium caeni]
MKQNIIATKTFEFSLTIIALYLKLKSENEYVLSRQLLRSATSIGANVEEAIAAQSKRDFVNKMSIASKEARETKYWLRLLERSELSKLEMNEYLKDIEHIINIISKIVKTSSEARTK